MNYAFQSCASKDSAEAASFFYGYRMTSFATFTFAICQSNEIAEELKMYHVYAEDWLKSNKANSSELFKIISGQLDQKYTSLIPAFVLLEGNEKGTVHMLQSGSYVMANLCRKNHVINISHPYRLDRLRLGWHSIASEENKNNSLVAFRCKLSQHDELVFHLDHEDFPKTRGTQGVIAKIILS